MRPQIPRDTCHGEVSGKSATCHGVVGIMVYGLYTGYVADYQETRISSALNAYIDYRTALENCKLTTTLTFDLLTSNKMCDQYLSRTVHLPSSVIFIIIYSYKKPVDKTQHG